MSNILGVPSTRYTRLGKLFGIGTGSMFLPAGLNGPLLWFRNDSTTEDFQVQKIIFGWDGGNQSVVSTVFSLIFYNTSAPTGNHSPISFAVENIAFAGAVAPASGFKWNGVGLVGMTGSSGGFAQIPNRLQQGNNSIAIDGEISLGAGNTMAFSLKTFSAGTFQVSVVGWWTPML